MEEYPLLQSQLSSNAHKKVKTILRINMNWEDSVKSVKIIPNKDNTK